MMHPLLFAGLNVPTKSAYIAKYFRNKDSIFWRVVAAITQYYNFLDTEWVTEVSRRREIVDSRRILYYITIEHFKMSKRLC